MKLLNAFLKTSLWVVPFTGMVFVMHYFGARSGMAILVTSFSIMDWLIYMVVAIAGGTALIYFFEER